MVLATVLVPTYDHGPTLLRSVGSVLRQTVHDLEVFIVGDGVPDATRDVVAQLQRDPRVRFFDNPKGPRLGEVHRHAALTEASGEIVCYLSDDDLWMPEHVETMRALLRDADFAHALLVSIDGDGDFVPELSQHALPADRDVLLSGVSWVPLSCGAHTLECYRRLPYGWRTTPPGVFTDWYMWHQIVSQPDCHAISGTRPTVLNFPSSRRRGWTIERRVAELDAWVPRLADPELVYDVLDRFVRERVRTRLYAESLERQVEEIQAHVASLQREVAAQRAAMEEAERYAKSLADTLTRQTEQADAYVVSLREALETQTTAFREAERYAVSLEEELGRRS
jgi:GalNAc5-diNAcBac-PP-undecaprenol beta-1,3-glucosyltransferase